MGENIMSKWGKQRMAYSKPSVIYVLIVSRKSRLRQYEEPALGPRYVGSRVSREALLQQDSDGNSPAAFGSSGTESAISEADIEDFEDDEDEEAQEAYREDERIGDDGEHEDDHELNGTARLRTASGIKEGTGKATNGESRVVLPSRQAKNSGNDLEHQYDETFNGISDSEQSRGSGFEDRGFESDSENGDDYTNDEDKESEENSEDEEDDADPRGMGSASRAELRKMMSEEQKTVVKTIAEATKADAEKGRALKHQRKAYDALLGTRIRLQKALVAVNSMPLAQASEPDTSAQDDSQVYAAAEEVALRLWTQLSDLRSQLHQALPISHSTRKRKRASDPSTPSPSELAQELREDESAASPYHRAILEKWSAKVRGAGNQTATTSRLNNTIKQPTITDVLNEHLSQPERLMKRTQVPRSCAPLQAQSKVLQHESVEIYDDADFYQLQLKELIDQRMLDSSTTTTTTTAAGGSGGQNAWTAMREAKTRKKVDTRASKGRKIRYTVHEKLQNFMVADDRGSWGKRQVDELFGSLLGARMQLEEDEDEGREGDAGGMEDENEMAGLMLFRGR